MTTHHLKTVNPYFEALWCGRKTFEIREERDRKFRVGDMLVLREYNAETDRFTGRVIRYEVTYCLRGVPFVPAGYVCMGLSCCHREDP